MRLRVRPGSAGPLAVPCPRCKARPGTRCFDPGPTRAEGVAVHAHVERTREADERRREREAPE